MNIKGSVGGASVGGSSSANAGSLDGYKTGTSKISDNVLALKDKITKYAKQNGIEDQVDMLLALTQQESGGDAKIIANDPMQSAEGHGLKAGALHDQEKSISWGVEEYAKRLKDANGDIPLTLQSYNFGPGFISYVKNHGGKMTQELVDNFSAQQAKENGWSSYGDKHYPQNVLRFYQGSTNTSSKSYAIGSKNLAEDGLIYAHKGEQIIRADENPDNPANVSSTSSMLRSLTGAIGSSKVTLGGNLNITVTVNGQGFSKENQNAVANATVNAINNNQSKLMSLLANGVTREVR